jgi:DNA-binding response OmpR family regulator
MQERRAMYTSQSDGTNSTIDIFVLSRSETAGPLLIEHLEKKEYQITLFTDGKNLLEALVSGKPNLIICDTTTSDKEFFEVCRRIKADEYLWAIPILNLTNVSRLSDLFDVLDCNADNLLPFPFDLPFGLSVIESMLRTPVERQISDNIKTQFKIRHDDRTYIVAANRRKLLELLLSSFEIAVNTSSALSHVKADLQTLSESAKYLEGRVAEQARLIDTIQTTLHQKEKKILTLTSEAEEMRKLLAQKTRNALIVTDDGNSHTLFPDIKGIEVSSFSEITVTGQQISELLHEVETAKTSLDTVFQELEDEKNLRTSLECKLELIDQQKEQNEKLLKSITDEHKQLVSAFDLERDRVVSAELEIKAAMQAKTQSEQDLTHKINELNERDSQKAADLIRLKNELEMEVTQRISVENEIASLIREKERLELLIQPTADVLKDQFDDLQLQLKNTLLALENEENITKLLKEKLAEIVIENKKTEIRVNLANQSRAQSDHQVHLLAEKLKNVQTELENERQMHQAAEKNIDTLMLTLHRKEEDLCISVEEQIRLKELLGNERKSRVTAEADSQTACEGWEPFEQKLLAVPEEQVRQENDRILKIQNPDEESELVSNQKKSVEKHVTVLTDEKTKDEMKVKDFTHNHDWARNSNGEKGVNHNAIDDSFVSFGEEFSVRKKFSPIEEAPSIKKENVQSNIVKEADFPIIAESPHSAFVSVTIPDIQKSPCPGNKLTSSKPFSQNPEIYPKAVTDIINTFSDNDLLEEN